MNIFDRYQKKIEIVKKYLLFYKYKIHKKCISNILLNTVGKKYSNNTWNN